MSDKSAGVKAFKQTVRCVGLPLMADFGFPILQVNLKCGLSNDHVSVVGQQAVGRHLP